MLNPKSTDTPNEIQHLIIKQLKQISAKCEQNDLQYKTQMQFSFSASTSDEITFPSHDKTTTTVRITIHNKCNKCEKSENEHINESKLLIQKNK